MKIYPDKRYDVTISRQDGSGYYKLHAFLSNRFPAEILSELAAEGLSEKDVSIYWNNVERK